MLPQPNDHTDRRASGMPWGLRHRQFDQVKNVAAVQGQFVAFRCSTTVRMVEDSVSSSGARLHREPPTRNQLHFEIDFQSVLHVENYVDLITP